MAFFMSIFSFLIVVQTGMTMIGLSRTEKQRARNLGPIILGALFMAGILFSLLKSDLRLIGFLTGIYYVFLSLDVMITARTQPRVYWWLVPIYLMMATGAILAGVFNISALLLITYVAFWVLTYLVGRRVLGN